jgi:hypothetical protein
MWVQLINDVRWLQIGLALIAVYIAVMLSMKHKRVILIAVILNEGWENLWVFTKRQLAQSKYDELCDLGYHVVWEEAKINYDEDSVFIKRHKHEEGLGGL